MTAGLGWRDCRRLRTRRLRRDLLVSALAIAGAIALVLAITAQL